MMTEDPASVMAVLVTMILVIASWYMRACEMYHFRTTTLSYPDALWLVAITFLTVGYGDISPYR